MIVTSSGCAGVAGLPVQKIHALQCTGLRRHDGRAYDLVVLAYQGQLTVTRIVLDTDGSRYLAVFIGIQNRVIRIDNTVGGKIGPTIRTSADKIILISGHHMNNILKFFFGKSDLSIHRIDGKQIDAAIGKNVITGKFQQTAIVKTQIIVCVFRQIRRCSRIFIRRRDEKSTICASRKNVIRIAAHSNKLGVYNHTSLHRSMFVMHLVVKQRCLFRKFCHDE